MSESTEFITLPLDIEIARDIRDLNLGLMFRESLDFNSGMLFIFDEVGTKILLYEGDKNFLTLLSLQRME